MVADNMARPIDGDGIEGGDEARFLRANGDTRATVDTGIPIDNKDNRHNAYQFTVHSAKSLMNKATVQLGAKKPGFFTPEAPSSYEKLHLTGIDWLEMTKKTRFLHTTLNAY